jgi:phosphopantothenoylcysteine synthetase/decarboxylase
VLHVVVCAAGPASEVDTLVTAAQATGWDVHLFATPAALEFLDLLALEALTGHPVRSSHRGDGQARGSTPHADAIIVAPASFNTINKLALESLTTTS